MTRRCESPPWRLAGLFAAPAASAAADRKPNVVVFFIDDMGYADLGCYGGKLAPTPHCDSLARNGVRFTDGYVSACVCSPSRVGLMTGRYQARTGHDANTAPARAPSCVKTEVTIAQRLKAAGYATGIVGKWHLGEGKEYLPGVPRVRLRLRQHGQPGREEGHGRLLPRHGGRSSRRPSTRSRRRCTPRRRAGSSTRNKDRPFFLYLAFNAVHAPRVATEATLKKFAHLGRASSGSTPPAWPSATTRSGPCWTKLRR